MNRVLFVCTGNFYRSRFAEAVFNHHAEQEGLDWHAYSRGLAIHLADGDISHYTHDALTARGIARHRTGPTRVQIADTDLASGARVIALDRTEHWPMMQRQFAAFADKIEYWEVADIPFSRPDDALPAIEKRVLALIEELKTSRVD